jgi:hypothetical protein
MKTLIKIEKDDISTNRLGINVEVQVDEKLSLVFSLEALDELVKDYSSIKTEILNISTKIISINSAQLEIPFPDDIDELYKSF